MMHLLCGVLCARILMKRSDGRRNDHRKQALTAIDNSRSLRQSVRARLLVVVVVVVVVVMCPIVDPMLQWNKRNYSREWSRVRLRVRLPSACKHYMI